MHPHLLLVCFPNIIRMVYASCAFQGYLRLLPDLYNLRLFIFSWCVLHLFFFTFLFEILEFFLTMLTVALDFVFLFFCFLSVSPHLASPSPWLRALCLIVDHCVPTFILSLVAPGSFCPMVIYTFWRALMLMTDPKRIFWASRDSTVGLASFSTSSFDGIWHQVDKNYHCYSILWIEHHMITFFLLLSRCKCDVIQDRYHLRIKITRKN